MQTSMNFRYILGVDPSGSYHEGAGTTGFALYDSEEDKILWVNQLRAHDFENEFAYYKAHFDFIYKTYEAYGCLVSIEDYILYSGARQVAQTWSHMETVLLIGFMKVNLYYADIPFNMRTASVAKRVWSEEKLINKGYITLRMRGKSKWYYLGDQHLLTHHCDAIKHAIKGKSEEAFAIWRKKTCQ